MSSIIIVVLILVMTISGTFGALFFKKATTKLETGNIFSLLSSAWLYLGGGCYVLGAALNILLLRYVDYSILYPMTCLTYIWTMFVSYLAFGEKITKYKIIAVVCIAAGVILVAL